MKFKISILLLFTFLITKAQYYDPEKAQEVKSDSISIPKPTLKPAYDIWKHLYYGANFQIRPGTRASVYELSPLVGLNIIERFSAGFLFTCIYYKPANFTGIGIFGLTPFTRFLITDDIYIIGELSTINYPKQISAIGVEKRKWEVNPMLGLGYLLKLSDNFAFTTSFMYNFNHKKSEIYGAIVLRAGFVFSFD